MAPEQGLTVLREREMMPVGGSHAAYIDARRDVIVETFIPEAFRANAALVGMFLDLCKARGLNPFAKQIYVIPRGRKPSIEIAIDGYRLIAARAPGYAGLDEYEYDATAAEHPEWARCTVYKLVGGLRCPFTARVLWKEFGAANVATDYDNQWKKRPYHMLGITAERHALRMAFPEEMGAVEAVNGELGGEESASDVPPPREVREPGKAIAQPARVAPLSAPRARPQQQPNGAEEQRRKFAEAAQTRGLPIHEDMTSDDMAAIIDVALGAAGIGFRVARTEEGVITARALHNALMAIPPRAVDPETGEVIEGESREAGPDDDYADIAAATDQGVLLARTETE